MVHPGKQRSTHHTVRFTGDDHMPKYKPIVSILVDLYEFYRGTSAGQPETKVENEELKAIVEADPSQSTSEIAAGFGDSTDSPNYVSSQSYPGQDSGAPSPDPCSFQPAAQRYRLNEQRIKLLTSINQIVQQRADLESNRMTLSNLLDELRRKLKRRIDECHIEKKERMKNLKQANQRLEKEKFNIVSEIEHLKRHLEKEEAHHLQHARTAVAQAIQGVVTKCPVPDSFFNQCSMADLPNVVSRNVAKNAPSRNADNKLAAARLMRDIAELRQRVAQVEQRLASELRRKRQAELDIIRLRKELSSTKSFVASLRLPPPPMRKQCSKFA